MEYRNRLKVAFHTLGCKVNQYESEALKEQFIAYGDEIVDEDSIADVYIVNTCTVTGIADRKSRQYIKKMKRKNPDSLMVVTGCYAQVASYKISKIEEVDMIIGNSLKSTICDKVHEETALRQEERSKFVHVLGYSELNYYEDMGVLAHTHSDRCRAYIKIQEGCNRFCSYCMIPFARGIVRSRPYEEIIEEARSLVLIGVKEIILTGINTALYGFDFHNTGNYPLSDLIKEINEIEGDFRIRLSSLEPTVVKTDDVKSLIGYEKLCHHLHLSAQSGNANILKRMNRTYDRDEYLKIVKALKEFDPLYGITTDIIVGFPGETEADFDESISLIENAGFCRVHAFKYSPRNGTKAAAFEDKVPAEVKNERITKLVQKAAEVSRDFIAKNRGVYHRVLTEERTAGFVTGYTDNYIRVYMPDDAASIEIDEFYEVELKELYKDGCLAVPKVLE